jgi:hypothetical protein
VVSSLPADLLVGRSNPAREVVLKKEEKYKIPWRRGQVASSPSATEEIGAEGRVIESRQGGSF